MLCEGLPCSEVWDLFCGDATEMLEGKVLRLNVSAVRCSGHTALVIMAARVRCALPL